MNNIEKAEKVVELLDEYKMHKEVVDQIERKIQYLSNQREKATIYDIKICSGNAYQSTTEIQGDIRILNVIKEVTVERLKKAEDELGKFLSGDHKNYE